MAGTGRHSRSPRAPLRLSSGRSKHRFASRVVPPEPNPRGSDMRYFALAAILFSAATLGGCNGGVLDPQGPIAAAERLGVLHSTGIPQGLEISTILHL